MPELITDFLAYLKAVFVESGRWVLIMFDVLVIGLWLYLGEDLTGYPAHVRIVIGGGVFLISFILANFTLYRTMKHEASIPPWADIHLVSVEESDFSPPQAGVASPFPKVKSSPRGLSRQGLPLWGSLWARIRVANYGDEEGELVWELDRAKTKLPPLFDCENVEVQFTPRRVNRRDRFDADFYFYILFSVQEPRSFAQSVKALVEDKKGYRIVLKYWTERVEGKSKPRRFPIEGDFKRFHRNMLQRWRDWDLSEWAKLAEVPGSHRSQS